MTFILVVPLVGQTCFPIVVGAIVFALYYFAFHHRKTSKTDYSNYPNDFPKNARIPRSIRRNNKKYEAILDAEHRGYSSSSDSEERDSRTHDPSKPHICSSESKQKISFVKIWYNKKEFSEGILDELLQLLMDINLKGDLCDLTNSIVLPNDVSILNLFLIREHSLHAFDVLKELSEGRRLEEFLYHICSFRWNKHSEYEFEEELGGLLESCGGTPLKKFAYFSVCETKGDHFNRYKKKLSRILRNSSKKCCGSCIKGKTVDIEDIAWPIPPPERVKGPSPAGET